MRFQRTELIARAQAAIVERERAAAAKEAERLTAVQTQRDEWVAKHGDAFTELAKAIIRRTRKGEPVTVEDVPAAAKDRYGSVSFFSPGYPSGTPITANTASLTRFIAVLGAVTDDEVSSAGLRDLGFTDLNGLF